MTHAAARPTNLVLALLVLAALDASTPAAAQVRSGSPVTVTIGTFIRAETDSYFKTMEFGKLRHSRTMASIDKQDVVRMNRDTLYSSGVFELEAAPVTVSLPDVGRCFMSMQVISTGHVAGTVSHRASDRRLTGLNRARI
jgi:para-nitrobenzyl esterase